MPEILELAELLQHDRVPEVDVAGGGIQSQLDPQRAALGEPRREHAFRVDLDRIAREVDGSLHARES